MTEDARLRQDLLRRIGARRSAVHAWLRSNRPRVRRRANATIVLTSLAAAFTAGPAVGGRTFAASVQEWLGLSDQATVWRVLCFLALVVSVAAAIVTQLARTHDPTSRLSTVEAAAAELDGLETLLHYGHLSVQDAVKLYQQYNAQIPFVDDLPPVPGSEYTPQSRPV